MARSSGITAAGIRAAFRFVGECRELGSDFAAWRTHFQAGLARLAGGTTGIGALTSAATPDGRMAVHQTVGAHWPSAAAARTWLDYNRNDGQNHDPVVRQLAAAGLDRGVWTRRQGAEDRLWYGSSAFQTLCRPFSLDDSLMSVAAVPGGGLDWVVLFRESGDPPFPDRAFGLISAYHAEIARMIGGSLAHPGDPSPAVMAPRLRQTLAFLVRGATDKEIARGLGVRPPTAHQYVLSVFRLHGVHSRGELIAYYLGRDRRPPPPPPT